MVVQIGGGALAVICLGLLIALGINECSKGPLEPDAAVIANAGDAEKDWLRVQHRIQRSDSTLTDISRDQQTLMFTYHPSSDESEPQDWAHTMLRVVGGGLGALSNSPGGEQYRQVRVTAQMRVSPPASPAEYAEGAVLVYDMSGFDAIKTQQDGYATFASAPETLTLSDKGREVATDYCRGSGAGFYPEFCQRVLRKGESQ